MLLQLLISLKTCTASTFYLDQLEGIEEDFTQRLSLHNFICMSNEFLINFRKVTAWNDKLVNDLPEIKFKVKNLRATFKILAEFTANPEIKEKIQKCREVTKSYKLLFIKDITWLTSNIFSLLQEDLETGKYKYIIKNIKSVKKHFEEYRRQNTILLRCNDIVKNNILP